MSDLPVGWSVILGVSALSYEVQITDLDSYPQIIDQLRLKSKTINELVRNNKQSFRHSDEKVHVESRNKKLSTSQKPRNEIIH